MKYFIIGSYGHNNLGDDILCHNLLKGFYDRDKKCTFVLNVAPHAEYEQEVPLICREQTTITKSTREALGKLHDADAIVFGGGTLVHRFGTGSLLWNLIAEAKNIPVFWAGVGAEKIDCFSNNLKARISTSLCHWIGARDLQSASIFRSLSTVRRPIVEQTEDLFFLNKSLLSTGGCKATEKYVLLTWHSFHLQLNRDECLALETRVMNAIAQFCSTAGIQKLIIASMSPADDLACERMHLAFTRHCMLNPHGITDLELRFTKSLHTRLALILDCSLLFSSRLHPWMVAKSSTIPSIAIAYAEKITFFDRKLTRSSSVTFRHLLGATGHIDLINLMCRELACPARLQLPWEHFEAASRKNIESIVSLL